MPAALSTRWLATTSCSCSIFPADRTGAAVVGWKLFGPPRHQELIDHGDAQTFDDAKAAAERAFAKLQGNYERPIS
jgi:hypothetical protein